MAASANDSPALLPAVLVLDASDAFIERCRSVLDGLARVERASLDDLLERGSGKRFRAIVLTVEAYGRATQPITDFARRHQARVVKLPTEQMPDRYLGEVLVAAVGTSGVRRLFVP